MSQTGGGAVVLPLGARVCPTSKQHVGPPAHPSLTLHLETEAGSAEIPATSEISEFVCSDSHPDGFPALPFVPVLQGSQTNRISALRSTQGHY